MKEIYCLKHKKWCLEFCTDCRIAEFNIHEIITKTMDCD